MTVLKTRDVRTNFCRKGFREEERDHLYLLLYVDGKKTSIHTKMSHGKNEISDPLIGKMAKQVKLSKHDFIDFAKCILTEEQYIKKVKKYL